METGHYRETAPKDHLSRRATLAAIALTTLGAVALTLIAWFFLKTTNFPAFTSSMVTRALASVGIIVVIILVVALLWFWKKPGPVPRWRKVITYIFCYLSPAALVISTLGVPLSATRLYLDGVTVDQGFRTQYLTRATDSLGLSDMNYLGLPAHYPGGWFWLGGRLANILHMPGWETFQPWSITSIAIAASILVPVWQRISQSLPLATGIALVNTCIAMVMSAEEPYAAIVALGVPAFVAIAPSILRGGRLALLGGIVCLGFSATFYTLFTAVTALFVVVLGLVYAVKNRSFYPVLRVAILGFASVAIALIAWAPYLLASARSATATKDSALHYLPLAGTQFPLPFLAPSVIGVLCFVGLVFLVLRWKDPISNSLITALVVFYLWLVASMLATLVGTTLLGFRVTLLIVLVFATAGVMGLAQIPGQALEKYYPDRVSVKTSRVISAVLVLVFAAGALQYAQDMPQKLKHFIDLAYTDTDGFGDRADRYPAGSGRYYQELNAHLQDRGFVPASTVVLTDEQDFMSFFPYRGFQAFTPHYANPLGQYQFRNERLEAWAEDSWDSLSAPRDFTDALAESPWVAPEVFILRGDAADMEAGWKYDLSEGIYPNNPNVRFRGVYFNPKVFSGDQSLWEVKQIGPFVVVTAQRG